MTQTTEYLFINKLYKWKLSTYVFVQARPEITGAKWKALSFLIRIFFFLASKCVLGLLWLWTKHLILIMFVESEQLSLSEVVLVPDLEVGEEVL